MPGSVANAAPTEVLPQILCLALQQDRHYELLANEYQNGESQRSLLVATSRKAFVARFRKDSTALVPARDFFDARKGSHQPFYLYYPFETSPKFSHDPSGVATTGRYTVRLDGDWQQIFEIARGEYELRFVELA